ncbi:MAG: hypothetical protein ISS35_07975 [Kiritimatiellae bacterium]|nr:hypothetical protein [Kiritimatiellia bacterium]
MILVLQALHRYTACMKKPKTQYTIRNVPERLDAKLRETAIEYGQSLNEASLAALKKGLGAADAPPPAYHDLDDLAGTWVKDKASERALNEMRQIDKEMWK